MNLYKVYKNDLVEKHVFVAAHSWNEAASVSGVNCDIITSIEKVCDDLRISTASETS